MYKTIQIDLGNAPTPNWRYITGIYGNNDITYSIYPNNKINEDRLKDCKAIYPKMNFKIVDVQS
jgi:hypothetical protein